MRDYYDSYGRTPSEGQQAQRGRSALQLALNPEDSPGEMESMPVVTNTPPESILGPEPPAVPAPNPPTPPAPAPTPPSNATGNANTTPGTTTTPVTSTGQITTSTVQSTNLPTDDAGPKILNDYLNNPYSLSDEIVAKMKEKQKEEMLSMYGQQGDSQLQSMASRGMLDSGMTDAYNRSQGDALTAALTNGYRDLDIQQALSRNIDARDAIDTWEKYRQYNMNYGQDEQQWADDMQYKYFSTMTAADIEAWFKARGW